MKGYKSSTIYKSGSCDLGPKHMVRVHVGSYCYRNTQRCGSGGLGHRTTALLSNSM
jgi:hypothetical protein